MKAVDVIGVTKGRGFSGVMKRHNFNGQRATHGVKKVHRHMGGTGALAANRGGGRMKKGKKMPGQIRQRAGHDAQHPLVRIDKENNLLLINGCGAGPERRLRGRSGKRTRWDRAVESSNLKAHGKPAKEYCRHGKLPVYISGAEVGKYEIDPAAIAPKINQQLLHDVVVMYQANQRQGTHRTKGRARSRRHRRRRCIARRGRATPAPARGAAAAPRRRYHVFALRPRDYSYRLPKKAVQAATRMAIASQNQAARTSSSSTSWRSAGPRPKRWPASSRP